MPILEGDREEVSPRITNRMSDLGLKTPTTLKPRKSKNAIRIPRLIVGVLPLLMPLFLWEIMKRHDLS